MARVKYRVARSVINYIDVSTKNFYPAINHLLLFKIFLFHFYGEVWKKTAILAKIAIFAYQISNMSTSVKNGSSFPNNFSCDKDMLK